MRADELPLFPLRTVLFPGGSLQLRIFEARYLDMVRLCTREQRAFGVCLILEGQESGEPARPAALGTTARIEDFYTLPDGMLGIACRGGQRFHVDRTRIRDNGLLVGDVTLLVDDADAEVRPEHGLLAQLLERVLEKLGGPHAKAERACFDQALWVGCRLAELLPFEAAEQQALLQCADPHARLQAIVEALPRLHGEG